MNEFDTSALAVPQQVSVAISEIAADLRRGLLCSRGGCRLAGNAAVDGGRRSGGLRAAGSEVSDKRWI